MQCLKVLESEPPQGKVRACPLSCPQLDELPPSDSAAQKMAGEETQCIEGSPSPNPRHSRCSPFRSPTSVFWSLQHPPSCLLDPCHQKNQMLRHVGVFYSSEGRHRASRARIQVLHLPHLHWSDLVGILMTVHSDIVCSHVLELIIEGVMVMKVLQEWSGIVMREFWSGYRIFPTTIFGSLQTWTSTVLHRNGQSPILSRMRKEQVRANQIPTQSLLYSSPPIVAVSWVYWHFCVLW